MAEEEGTMKGPMDRRQGLEEGGETGRNESPNRERSLGGGGGINMAGERSCLIGRYIGERKVE